MTDKTNGYQETPEEKALYDLFEKSVKKLSKPARFILFEADGESCAANLIHNCAYQPEEYDEAMKEMHQAAVGLTEEDCVLLEELVGAADAAASSIDPDDMTPVGYKVGRGMLRWYYGMAAGMVKEVIREARKSA